MTKAEQIEQIAEALVKGAEAIAELRKLRDAVHALLDCEFGPVPAKVLTRVRRLMYGTTPKKQVKWRSAA